MDKEEVKTEEVIDETSVAQGAEETPAPAKHKYADRLSKAYPDRQFEKDEDYDSAMDEHLTDLEGYRDRGQSTNKKLIALFEAEPQIGEIVKDCINGATFREALARHVSPEDLTAIEGDPDYEGWSKNKSAREESINKKKQSEEARAKNLSTSEAAITAYVEKKGMTEEQADEFFLKFDKMIEDVGNGIITEQHLDAWMKALNYDSDVVAATDQGRIAGRNESIVATKEAATTDGDGMPRPGRSNDEPEGPKKAPNYMDNLVERSKKRDVFA